MRVVAIGCLLVLCGCGQAPGGSAPAPAEQGVSVIGPTGSSNMNVHATDNSNVQTFAYPVDAVWRVLPAVFDSLGVPVSMMDKASHTIGNQGYTIRRRLKSSPLSHYIDCGSGGLGPNADDYDVRLTVLLVIRPTDGGSALTTTVEAVARPPNYAQDYSTCSSRGTLEAKLVGLVRQGLSK